MAVDPANEQSHSGDLDAHVRDYSAFISMLKWGAVISFVIAMLTMVVISN